jgi:uncharacterized protein involved in high-affinity Fe2+ transport
MRFISVIVAAVAALAPRASAQAPFREYPIGDAEKHFMTIAAVYLPPITMDAAGHDGGHIEQFAEPGKEKIHLEADIHATKRNPNGFAAGEWIPYLTVKYKLEHLPSGKSVAGKMMPMVAKDGPHYGASVRMMGKGKYKLTYFIEPPSATEFGRHTDPVTGVAEWWKPFEVSWEFEYHGLPKDK